MRVGLEAQQQRSTIAFVLPAAPVRVAPVEILRSAEHAGVDPVIVDVDDGSSDSTSDLDPSRLPDCILAIGARSHTAVSLAVSLDRPLMVASSMSPQLLRHIVQSLRQGTSIHRAALRLQIDRDALVATDEILLAGTDPMEITRRTGIGPPVIEWTDRASIRAEQPTSGRLRVRLGDRVATSADEITVRADPSVVARVNGWERSCTSLTVQVHANPLRELVLGIRASPRSADGLERR